MESVEPKFKTGLKMIKTNNENKDVDIERFKKGLKRFPISNKSTKTSKASKTRKGIKS